MHVLGLCILMVLALTGTENLDPQVRPLLDRVDALLEAGDATAARQLLQGLIDQNDDLRAGRHPLACEIWHQLAYAQYGENDFEAAAASLRQALAVAQAFPGESEPVSGLQYELGYLQWFDLGEVAAGAAALDAAVTSLRREGDDPLLRASWQSDLAEARRLLGEYEEAERLLRDTLALTQAAGGDSFLHAVVANNLGALYWDQNRLTEAERLYRESLALSRKLLEAATGEDVAPLARRVATAQLNLGVILHHQQRLQAAQRELELALALVQEDFQPGDAQVLFATSSLAKVCQELGDETRADELWTQALQQSSSASGEAARLRAEILHDRALALLDRGESDSARPLVEEAIALWSSSLGTRHPMVGRLLGTAARVESAHGDPATVIERCNQALGRLESHSFWPEVTAEVLTLRGQAYRQMGRKEAASDDITRALILVESLRTERGADDVARLAFVRRFASAAQSLVVWQVEEGRPGQAVNTAERIRARLLQDELRADRVDLYAGIDAQVLRPLLLRQQNARAHVAQLQRTLRASQDDASAATTSVAALQTALAQLQEVEDELRLHSPAWRRSLEIGAEEDLVAVAQQDLLAKGEAILYFDLGSVPNLVFFIPPAPAAVQAFPLGSASAAASALLTDDSTLARAMITDAMRGVGGLRVIPEEGSPSQVDLQLAQQLHRVFRWLVPPALWQQLASLRQVIVIPDAQLHALPFEALVVEEPRADSVRYWLDAGPTVTYGHSLGVLRELARRPRATGRLTALSVSNPTFDSGGPTSQGSSPLPPLPGTALESASVVEAFGPSQVRALQGPAATERAVRQHIGDARYLHLATHGLVDRVGDARLSALALTPSPESGDLGDDGFLQLFEIYDLHLNCDLAVLSACETQAGQRLEGEGVFALSRGFHVAGAHQTIASLWSVNDFSTAALMGELFSGIAAAERQGQTPQVATILREAKQTIRADSKWSHPAYWAPFVLTGWGARSTTKENSP